MFKRLRACIYMFVYSLLVTQLYMITVSASHHFETELAKQHPAFDVTDAFVFESSRPGFTTFILDVNPTSKPSANSFADNGLYNMHIGFDNSLTKGMTYTFKFTGDNYELGQLDLPNTEIGRQGVKIAKGKLGQTTELENGMKIWTGVIRDPFMGNAVGIQAFSQNLNKRVFEVNSFDNRQDFFASIMVGSIVLEVPNTMLGEEVHYFVTSAVQINDEWQQVNRVANVLITHLFFGNNVAEINEHVHHRPDSDKKRAYAISNRVLRAVSLAKSKSNPVEYADQVADMMMPDLLTYKIGSPAEYAIEARNGRRLSDDAMDVVLSIFSGKPVTDYANTSDRYQANFPYVTPVKVN